jgi:hypothetical protein
MNSICATWLPQLLTSAYVFVICAAGAVSHDSDAGQPSDHGLTRRQLLSAGAGAALVASSVAWTPAAGAEPGANPVTGTREPLTMAEPTDTEGVRIQQAVAQIVTSASVSALEIMLERGRSGRVTLSSQVPCHYDVSHCSS